MKKMILVNIYHDNQLIACELAYTKDLKIKRYEIKTINEVAYIPAEVIRKINQLVKEGFEVICKDVFE